MYSNVLNKMNWKNAQKDELPKNDEEVIIAVRGVYYVATYNEELEGFRVNETTFFSLKEVTIYWAAKAVENL